MDAICRELKGRTVLIVDDDMDFADIMRDQLESLGMNVVGVAHNADSALRMIDELDPSLLILDIAMSGMDGIELAVRINATEPRPILFLSNYATSDYIDRARKSGVFTYLIKSEVVDKIEKIVPSIVLTLDHFREMSALRATVDTFQESESNTKIISDAVNFLIRERGMSEQTAYDHIRDRSFRENKPLADVAGAIISPAGKTASEKM